MSRRPWPPGEVADAEHAWRASPLHDTAPEGIPPVLDFPFPASVSFEPIPLAPVRRSGGAAGRRARGLRSRAAHGGGGAHSATASSWLAGVVLATVVPLCILQVPYAPLLAYAGAAHTAGAAAAAAPAAAVLRAASLALPFGVAAAPLAALAAWRLRAWPVLLAGLLVIVVGDELTGIGGGDPAASGALVAAGGALAGAGAGLAFPAAVALVTEHSGLPRRLLAAWWAAVTIAALAVLPGISLEQPAVSGWRAVLGPVPLLTAAALVAVAAYAVTAGRLWPGAWRGNGVWGSDIVPSACRAQLALLAPAAAAIAVLAVAATYRPGDTITVAAVCAIGGLLVIAASSVRGAPADGFPRLCAVAGFVLAPAAAAFDSARAIAGTGTAGGTGALLAASAVTGAIAGSGMALLRRPVTAPDKAGPGPVWGLLLAAAALAIACYAGPFAAPAALAVLLAAVTGGLAAALARSAGEATTAGAFAGAVILAAAVLAGYLAAGAIRVRLAGTAAVGWWELAAAAVAVTMVIIRYARRTPATGRRGGRVTETRRHSRRAPGKPGKRPGARVRPVHG